MKDDKKIYRVTTFQLSNHLHTQLRMMCVLTNKSMGEFIRLAIKDKISELKGKEKGSIPTKINPHQNDRI